MVNEAHRWIFLRGLGRHSQHWGEFVAQFKERFPLWTVELLDLAGNGTEAERESFFRVASYTDDLRSRSKLAQMGPVSILGISMGAMVGADWADRYPNEISNLVMINTSSGAESKFYERLRPRNYMQMLEVYKRRTDLIFRERAILGMTATPLPHLARLAELQSHLTPTRPDNFLRQILASSQFKFAKQKPKADVLILNAKGDNLVNPICSERLAKKWQASLKTHPSGDHDLPLVDAPWLLTQLHSWK